MELGIAKETMSAEFTKFHIQGLPFSAVIHHFTAKDIGDPHDHPFAFTSHILKGSYVEEIYMVEPNNDFWSYRVIHRAGEIRRVEAGHIHEIVELPEGECYTLILPEEKTRESHFWRFTEEGIFLRAWFEKEFKKYDY